MSSCNVRGGGGAGSFKKHTETHLFGHLNRSLSLLHSFGSLEKTLENENRSLDSSPLSFKGYLSSTYLCKAPEASLRKLYLAQLMLAANLSPYPVSTVKNEPVTASGRAVASPLPP